MALISPMRRLQWIIRKDDSTDSTESGENDSTASESDSESGASADTDSSSEDADSKTTTVDKQLVIYVGDEAGDGSRYVTVDNRSIQCQQIH